MLFGCALLGSHLYCLLFSTLPFYSSLLEDVALEQREHLFSDILFASNANMFALKTNVQCSFVAKCLVPILIVRFSA